MNSRKSSHPVREAHPSSASVMEYVKFILVNRREVRLRQIFGCIAIGQEPRSFCLARTESQSLWAGSLNSISNVSPCRLLGEQPAAFLFHGCERNNEGKLSLQVAQQLSSEVTNSQPSCS